jgi:hypothetical protein
VEAFHGFEGEFGGGGVVGVVWLFGAFFGKEVGSDGCYFIMRKILRSLQKRGLNLHKKLMNLNNNQPQLILHKSRIPEIEVQNIIRGLRNGANLPRVVKRHRFEIRPAFLEEVIVVLIHSDILLKDKQKNLDNFMLELSAFGRLVDFGVEEKRAELVPDFLGNED